MTSLIHRCYSDLLHIHQLDPFTNYMCILPHNYLCSICNKPITDDTICLCRTCHAVCHQKCTRPPNSITPFCSICPRNVRNRQQPFLITKIVNGYLNHRDAIEQSGFYLGRRQDHSPIPRQLSNYESTSMDDLSLSSANDSLQQNSLIYDS